MRILDTVSYSILNYKVYDAQNNGTMKLWFLQNHHCGGSTLQLCKLDQLFSIIFNASIIFVDLPTTANELSLVNISAGFHCLPLIVHIDCLFLQILKSTIRFIACMPNFYACIIFRHTVQLFIKSHFEKNRNTSFMFWIMVPSCSIELVLENICYSDFKCMLHRVEKVF